MKCIDGTATAFGKASLRQAQYKRQAQPDGSGQARERRSPSPQHLSTSAQYVLITLHRPSNVDEPETLREILLALDDIAQEVSVVFPVHPHTRQRIDDLGFGHWSLRFRLLEPLGYLDFLAL